MGSMMASVCIAKAMKVGASTILKMYDESSDPIKISFDVPPGCFHFHNVSSGQSVRRRIKTNKGLDELKYQGAASARCLAQEPN